MDKVKIIVLDACSSNKFFVQQYLGYENVAQDFDDILERNYSL